MTTEILSIITTLMALFTASIPLIQSYINKRSDEKNKRIEYLYKNKLETFKSLMDSFGKFRRNTTAHIDEFLSFLCQLMLFCNKEINEQIKLIIEQLKSEPDKDRVYYLFEKLIPHFSSEIQQTQNILFGSLNKNVNNRKNNTEKSKNDTSNNK